MSTFYFSQLPFKEMKTSTTASIFPSLEHQYLKSLTTVPAPHLLQWARISVTRQNCSGADKILLPWLSTSLNHTSILTTLKLRLCSITTLQKLGLLEMNSHPGSHHSGCDCQYRLSHWWLLIFTSWVSGQHESVMTHSLGTLIPSFWVMRVIPTWWPSVSIQGLN